MKIYAQSAEEAVRRLASDARRGLIEAEVTERRLKYGENKLAERKKKSMALRFFEQFKDVMILILLAAAVVSFIVACVNGDPKEFIEPALIVFIVILNAVMGLVQ